MPHLVRKAPTQARGVVLMLHGGAQHGRDPVSSRSLSWWRMRRLYAALAGDVLARGNAAWLLRFSVRGWNDPAAPSPVPDARWALEQVRSELPGLPVVLLGHSMGARTAVRVADDNAVAGVVGLAPWFQREDPVEQLAGKRLVAGHGRRDRITSPAATREYLDRAAAAGADVEFHDRGPAGHYLLRDEAGWNRFARESVLSVLAAADRG